MRHLLLATVVSLVVVSGVFGQIAYKMGDNNGSAVIGLGGYSGLYGDSDLPALAVSYEVGFNENISIGGLAGFTQSTYNVSPVYPSWKWKYTYILIGARGAYHYDLMHNENIDTYGGVMLGYNIVSFSDDGAPTAGSSFFSASGSYLAYGGFIGGRYYFSPNLAVQAELGFGIGLLSVGISYKM